MEAPSKAEVVEFAAQYPGDLARGIPAVIRDVWSLDWIRYKVSSGTLEKKWREKMVLDWVRDWTNGHPKARGQKNAGIQAGGRTPAQARFELSRELEDLQERLNAAYETNVEPRHADVQREKELKKLIKNLPE